jgi:hypothetical protein
MIELGSRVRDAITGFEGIATSRAEFLYGCVRYGIESESLDKDDKPMEAQFFDEYRIEVLEEAGFLLPDKKSKKGKKGKKDEPPGGPKPNPTRNMDPRR